MKSTFLIKIGVALAVIVTGACSPINPSISKVLLTSHQNPEVAGTPSIDVSPSVVGPSIDSNTSTSATRIHMVIYRSRVLDGETFMSETLNLANNLQTVTLSPDDQALVAKESSTAKQFMEFKTTGRTTVSLDGCLPDSVVGRFEVVQPASRISENNLNEFDTTLSPPKNGEKDWVLAIASSVSPAIQKTVLRALVSVSITVDCGIGKLAPQATRARGAAPTPST